MSEYEKLFAEKTRPAPRVEGTVVPQLVSFPEIEPMAQPKKEPRESHHNPDYKGLGCWLVWWVFVAGVVVGRFLLPF